MMKSSFFFVNDSFCNKLILTSVIISWLKWQCHNFDIVVFLFHNYDMVITSFLIFIIMTVNFMFCLNYVVLSHNDDLLSNYDFSRGRNALP